MQSAPENIIAWRTTEFTSLKDAHMPAQLPQDPARRGNTSLDRADRNNTTDLLNSTTSTRTAMTMATTTTEMATTRDMADNTTK